MAGRGRGSWHMRGGKMYGKNYRDKSRKQGDPNTSNGGQPLKKTILQVEKGPYEKWTSYFPDEAYKEGSLTLQKVKSFESYISRNRNQYSFEKIEDKRSFLVDLKQVLKDEFLSDWNTFENDLNLQPEHTLNCLGLAMHQSIYSELESKLKSQLPDCPNISVDLPHISVRLINHSPIIQLKNLKVNYYGKLASVRGTVIRISNVKLICQSMEFQCGSCEGTRVLRQPDGVYTVPTHCPNRGCKNYSKFVPLFSSPLSVTNNWQLLKLQESVGSEQCEGGRIPRTVECELTNELVDCCTPGDDVTVTGIIRVRNQEESSNKNKQASMFLLYVDVVSVTNNKNQNEGCSSSSAIEFSLTDYYAIQKIHAEPALFKLLVHSLCPPIYGHEVVKAGFLLGLFGGKSNRDGTRSDIHVLVVGDPGLGKSQMLQSCCNVAARGVFVCGNTSTSSGLTVTMTRESGGEYSLEAGALVLADQGSCCIDEFDKMSANHAALLEAMEQQTISIAKAGVVCTLPARTSILAAANPAGGHYNKAKTVSENLRLGGALLSRFDLVFILLDKPDEHLDSLLSEHVLALHAGLKKKKSTTHSVCSDSTSNNPEINLRQRLKLIEGEDLDVIPHILLRKFIAYARKYVHPELSTEAAEVIKAFYLELRKQYKSESMPVTTRQLQSLIRLTQARAKLELRELATAADAMDVVEIMKYSLVDTFSDECGSLDFNRSQNGSGVSGRSKMKEFVNIIQRKAEMDSKSLFTTTELKEMAQRANINGFFDVLSSLNLQGYLLKKGSNLYQLQTVDY